MPNLSLTSSSRFPAIAKPAFFALLLALALLLPSLVAAPAADAAPFKRIVLGQANNRLEPNCGTDFSRDCVVEGKVTGYQVFRKGSSRKRSFVVPWSGKIVSWSISLSQPTRRNIKRGSTTYQAQFPFFNDIFGPPASARIAVLRPVRPGQKGPPTWRVVRQSPVQVLNPYFGRTVHFALERPLNVVRNQMVALTIPTWAPAVWKPRACSFNAISGVQNPDACARAGKDYTWRASRNAAQCGIGATDGVPNEALEKTRPQMRINSDRRYGCYYGENVLLYTATVIGKN
jgi:hypothetical protein